MLVRALAGRSFAFRSSLLKELDAQIEEEARPSLIPSLCTHCTRAGIEWRR